VPSVLLFEVVEGIAEPSPEGTPPETAKGGPRRGRGAAVERLQEEERMDNPSIGASSRPLSPDAAAERVTAFLRKGYGWMAVGLAISAVGGSRPAGPGTASGAGTVPGSADGHAKSGPASLASRRPTANGTGYPPHDARTPARRLRGTAPLRPVGVAPRYRALPPGGSPEISPLHHIQQLEFARLSPRRATRGARWIWLCIVHGAAGCSGPQHPRRDGGVEGGPCSTPVPIWGGGQTRRR